MSSLQERLLERYTEHYSRVNANIDPSTIGPRLIKAMQFGYGEYVDPLPQGSEVLDLGCGTGFLLYWLASRPNITAVGVDGSLSQVDAARKSIPSANVVCADGLDFLEANPNRFSGIFCIDVLEHVDNEDLCLRWIEASMEALKPGGFFYCRVPNAANLAGTYSRYMDLTHRRSFTSTSLIQLLDAGGLSDCHITQMKGSSLGGSARLAVEAALHRAVFMICGHPLERVFTLNVSALGYRKGDHR